MPGATSWVRLAARDRCPRLHRLQRHALHRRRRISRQTHPAHARRVGKVAALLPGRGQEGGARCRRGHPLVADFARAGLYRPQQRGHRRPADPTSRSARDHAHRRLGMIESGLKAIGREADPAVRETFTKYRKTHNAAVFDMYTPEIRECRRSSIITGLPDAYGRGRHHRRLPARGAVRRRPPHRREEGRARPDRRALADRGSDRLREEMADQLRALADLKTMARPTVSTSPAGGERPRGGAVDLFRLPRCHQGDERRRHVGGPRLDLPRHLHRARSRREGAHGGRGTGTRRPAGDEAAHRAFHAHAGVRTRCFG